MKKHISIIIVHYNTPKDTKTCLQSLFALQHDSFQYHIIVVDNGSKEAFSLPSSLLAEHPEIELIRSESNLGFSGGNNLGLQYAVDHHDSDFFLLLNSDTVVDPAFLQNMFQLASKEAGIGLVVPKIYFHRGYEFWQDDYQRDELHKVLWYAGGSIDWQNLLAFHIGVDEVDRGHFDSVSETEFATGCALLLSREALERVGLLDEAFFLYLEDVDYSVRVKEAKLRVLYCPTAKVWHKISRSTGGSGSSLQTYYQTRNRLYFFFKHGNSRNKLTALHLLFSLLRSGSRLERKACLDFLLGKMGKQPYI